MRSLPITIHAEVNDITLATRVFAYKPEFFRDARASLAMSSSEIGLFGENVTPVLVALRPTAAISFLWAAIAFLDT